MTTTSSCCAARTPISAELSCTREGTAGLAGSVEHGGLYAQSMSCDHQQRTECGWHQGYPFVSDCYALLCENPKEESGRFCTEFQSLHVFSRVFPQ